MKRDFLKLYHQQAANLSNSDRNVEFIFGENSNYHQIGKTYLQNEFIIEKEVADAVDIFLVNDDVIRLVKNAFAYCFKETRLSTNGGSDIEHTKYCGQAGKIMRALTKKVGEFFLSQFDKIDESQAEINNTSLKHILVNSHDVAANKRNIKRHLPSKHVFGFCRTSRKKLNKKDSI